MPNTCVCCGHTKGKGDKASMYRFPADKIRRQQWLVALNLTEDITEHTCVCSRHFLHGNSTTPVLDLGKRFASPKTINTERTRRAMKRVAQSPSVPTASKRLMFSAPTPGSTTDDEPMMNQCPYL